MSLKQFLTFAVIVILALPVACAPSPKETPEHPSVTSVEVSYNEFQKDPHITKRTEIGTEETLMVVLSSNPSTGFGWTEQARLGDATLFQQTGHRYLPPEVKNGTPLAGAAGKEEWTFKALRSGTTSISMDYSRPWAGGEKGVWTFELGVAIR